MEIWIDIKGFEGCYQVSNIGNVRNIRPYKVPKSRKGIPRNYVLNPKKDKDGYLQVELSVKSKLTTRKVHRLVAMHFIENPEQKKEVNHKDLNRANNLLENLEWCTRKENCHHLFRAKGIFGDKVKRI